ncbi:MAG: hypothetical protein GF411_13260 [Candidatus Lokiarchaeota archaeon]|nr:hypothetical protein [Candidatus Lokiarchaeota archaeon]
MQNIFELFAIDMLSTYIAIVAAIWTSMVLFNRWRQDKDPLTASLVLTFILQTLGLIGATFSEVFLRVFVIPDLVPVMSFLFSLTFLISFVPMAYFYGGLFQPRNKWYIPTIGFLAGNATMLTALAGEFYDPPIEVYLFLFLLTLLVFVPLGYSCFKTAPMASRITTKAKFWLVGSWGVTYFLSYVVIFILTIFEASTLSLYVAFTIAGFLISGAYVAAWLGWVMPDWFRSWLIKRFGE